MRLSRLKASLFGVLELPKNSTQNAGSNEKDAKEGSCSIDAPSAVFGIFKERISPWLLVGCEVTVRAAIDRAVQATRRESDR